jgi:hypothetical protein
MYRNTLNLKPGTYFAYDMKDEIYIKILVPELEAKKMLNFSRRLKR